VVVFGAGGLLVAAAIAAALLNAPVVPNTAPTGGTTTPVVQLPQLTEIPGAEPAAVENQTPAPQEGRVTPRPQNANDRPEQEQESGDDDEHDTDPTTTPAPTTSTTTTTTTTKAPPAIDPGKGDGTPASAVDQPKGQGVLPDEGSPNGATTSAPAT
jgi:hypothetical protein